MASRKKTTQSLRWRICKTTRIREKAFRNESLDRNDGRNVQRSADVSGNARHFCDGKFNFTGCEGERSGLNHWTGVTQATWNKSCGYYGKWTSVLGARTQLLGYEAERQKTKTSSQCGLVLLRRLSPAKFIRLSWITSDEKKVNKPLRRALRNGTLENPSQCEGFGCGHCHLYCSICNIRHCNINSNVLHCTLYL